MIVLDTNVVSELMKPAPDPKVVTWVRAAEEPQFVTTITIGEIVYGLERLPGGRRRSFLEAAAEELFDDFREFVLGFDATAARRYGALVAARERLGRPISTEDAQIAAICQAAEMACATRNTGDFDDLGLRLIDPWVS
ncbi:type II toxin-antitoxin system VapC family toxin [Microlunatus speluncae]|uniref:type II toxin-antitoxin system VapC family toxin n=1 Tax=Microlunatus speluncae TaxID=2594267 RepID=UPI00126626F2|nr:type II toxin-antitoxin system VapC family toxin [Microlunatus speluncae]